MTTITGFNIRVYAIIFDPDKKYVLLSIEHQKNMQMLKFPGGGLEFGEGTVDGLKREIREELNVNLTHIQHFYTTDFFQLDWFNNHLQLISIYYTAQLPFIKEYAFFSETKQDFKHLIAGTQILRRIKLTELQPSIFTFPIDQYVASLLINKFCFTT